MFFVFCVFCCRGVESGYILRGRVIGLIRIHTSFLVEVRLIVVRFPPRFFVFIFFCFFANARKKKERERCAPPFAPEVIG